MYDMITVQIVLLDEEAEQLKKVKNDLTWHDFIMLLAKPKQVRK